MLRKIPLILILVLSMLTSSIAAELERVCKSSISAKGSDEEPAELTLWLMPVEPPETATAEEGDLSDFLDKYGFLCPVTVLNLTDPFLRDQLHAWDPEFAESIWPVIKGQKQTLEALLRFAEKKHVHINIRFLSWGDALQELRTGILSDLGPAIHKRYPYPDVIQAGSTWTAYLASKNMLENTETSVIDYTVDLRLVFYWKRLPSAPADSEPFVMNGSTWQSLIESIKQRARIPSENPSPPMIIPIGPTLNLLHDFFPLIWASGQNGFRESFGRMRVELANDDALAIPFFLAQNTSLNISDRQIRLLTFPEMSHIEASRHFMNGKYLASIASIEFIRRWHDDFVRRHSSHANPSSNSSGQRFWDYAGVVASPASFKGGSNLVILRETALPDLARSLAQFLATDFEYTNMLAGLGYLPAQQEHKTSGIQKLLESVDISSTEQTAELKIAINEAKNKGRRYPSLVGWPLEIENPEVLETFQQLWRSIGQGDEDNLAMNRIKGAAKFAENAINIRINPFFRVRETLAEYSLIVAIMLLTFTSLSLGFVWVRFRYGRKEIEFLKSRFLSSNGIMLIGSIHDSLRHDRRLEHLEMTERQKVIIVRAILRNWQRALFTENWKEQSLEIVVWKAILRAIDSVCIPLLFEDWEKWRGTRTENEALLIQEFLHNKVKLLRNSQAVPGKEHSSSLHFCISGDLSTKVKMPLILEHGVACLIQNAIQHSKDSLKEKHWRSIKIDYDSKRHALVIFNEGAPMPRVICKLINNSIDLEDFAETAFGLLESENEARPGIGLAEAYSIAIRCYGGLKVEEAVTDQNGTRMVFYLEPKNQEKVR